MESSGERTALYRFFGADDRLLYVGITGRLGQRWEAHVRQKPWWPKVRRQTTEWYDSRNAAAAAEKRAIQDEGPLYNVVHAVRGQEPELRLPKFLILTLDASQAIAKTSKAEAEVIVNGVAARARDLLNDLSAVLGDERIRVSELPGLLRALAPEWEPYEKLTGVELAAALRSADVRVTNTGNVPRLDPRDLHAKRTAA